jgi:prevent-host-death family protein
MIRTLRESKAKLSELVDLASKGQEVLITVRGKVRARLTAVESGQSSEKRDAWVRELLRLQKAYGKRTRKIRSEDILADLREDRL